MNREQCKWYWKGFDDAKAKLKQRSANEHLEPTKLWCETCEGTGEVYQEHQAGCHVGGHFKCPDCDGEGYVLSRLYSTTPPPVPEAHKLKPLTDEQIEKCFAESAGTFVSAGRAIEAAHGITASEAEDSARKQNDNTNRSIEAGA